MASIPSGAPQSTAGGGRRWVPVSTGTTGRRRRTPQSSFPQQRESTAPHRHSRDGGNRRGGVGDGFPSPRERRAGGGAPHNRHSRDGGNPRRGAGDGYPVSTGTTDGDGRTHNRHSHNSGNPRQPHRHSRDGGNPRGGGDGFPSPRERRGGGTPPQSSFPRRRESTAGGRRWVPVSTGTTGRRRRTPRSSFPARRGSRDPGARPPPPSFPRTETFA